MEVEKLAEPLVRREVAALRDLGELLLRHVGEPRLDQLDQLLLGGEVGIQTALLDPDRIGNVLQAGAVDALLADQLDRGVEHLGMPLGGALGWHGLPSGVSAWPRDQSSRGP